MSFDWCNELCAFVFRLQLFYSVAPSWYTVLESMSDEVKPCFEPYYSFQPTMDISYCNYLGAFNVYQWQRESVVINGKLSSSNSVLSINWKFSFEETVVKVILVWRQIKHTSRVWRIQSLIQPVNYTIVDNSLKLASKENLLLQCILQCTLKFKINVGEVLGSWQNVYHI